MERVFVDANILYSRTIRDWLFALSVKTYSLKSFITIGEAIRNVPAMR